MLVVVYSITVYIKKQCTLVKEVTHKSHADNYFSFRCLVKSEAIIVLDREFIHQTYTRHLRYFKSFVCVFTHSSCGA